MHHIYIYITHPRPQTNYLHSKITPHSTGRVQDDKFLDEMVAEATGPINFTMFLTFMGDKLQNTDSDECLTNAFLTIDENNTGFIKQDV